MQEDLFDQILVGKLEFPSPYWDNITDSAKVLGCINDIKVEAMLWFLVWSLLPKRVAEYERHQSHCWENRPRQIVSIGAPMVMQLA